MVRSEINSWLPDAFLRLGVTSEFVYFATLVLISTTAEKLCGLIFSKISTRRFGTRYKKSAGNKTRSGQHLSLFFSRKAVVAIISERLTSVVISSAVFLFLHCSSLYEFTLFWGEFWRRFYVRILSSGLFSRREFLRAFESSLFYVCIFTLSFVLCFTRLLGKNAAVVYAKIADKEAFPLKALAGPARYSGHPTGQKHEWDEGRGREKE